MPASLLTVTPLTASGISHVFDNVPPTGLVMWLDATRISGVTSGTSLSAWTDQTTNANTPSNSLVTQQPLYMSAALGGMPAVRWAANACVLKTTQSLITVVPFTMATVSLISSIAGNHASLYNERWGLTSSGSAADITIVGVVDKASNPSFWSSAVITNAMYIVRSDNTIDFYLNGSLQTTVTGAAATGSAVSMSVGNRANFAQPFLGDMGELLLYNRALTAVEIDQLNTYLKQKWGIA